VSDPDSELRIEQQYAGRGAPPEAPRPVDRTLGDLADRLADRLLDEVESAELPLLSGDSLRIVCVDEVEQWLRGCAIRLRNGEPL
jgi:hypothetical protein